MFKMNFFIERDNIREWAKTKVNCIANHTNKLIVFVQKSDHGTIHEFIKHDKLQNISYRLIIQLQFKIVYFINTASNNNI